MHTYFQVPNSRVPFSMNGDSMKDNICRDFLRNVCNRGSSCKFRHPDGEEAKALGKKELIFCHDFQNKECRRVNCRFIHCTKQEEEMYRSSGFIAEHILESVNNKGAAASQSAVPAIPVCKDYIKGECKRSGRCKYRHVTPGQYHMENSNNQPPMVQTQQQQQPRRPPPPPQFENYKQPPFEGYEQPPQFDGFGVCEPVPKRQAYPDDPFFGSNGLQETYLPQHVRLLQEENARLMHKIEELKKQVLDLTATNQFLREQNEQIRGLASKDWYMSPYQNSYLPQ